MSTTAQETFCKSRKFWGHEQIQNTLKYIDLEANLFGECNDQFIAKIAANAKEAYKLAEGGLRVSHRRIQRQRKDPP